MRKLPIRPLAVLWCGLALSACSRMPNPADEALADYRPDAGRGRAIYAVFCAECHAQGENGAPRPDHPEDWAGRAVGLPGLLTDHAGRGFLDMPARGGRPELSRQNIADAVFFMVREVAIEEE
jgi:cytochrome c5